MDPGIPYAFFAVLSFSTCSFLFQRLTRLNSALWMNTFKACLATTLMVLCAAFTLPSHISDLTFQLVATLFLSGLIGLNLSDWFMLHAYDRMGPARTTLLYRFQPLYLGFLGSVFLGQVFTSRLLLAVGLLIGCVLLLSLERRQQQGHWDFKGVALALGGMLLDGTGSFLSSMALKSEPSISSLEANALRGVAALFGFALWSRFQPIGLVPKYRSLSPRLKVVALIAAFVGTFGGLTLWLNALKVGKLATVASVGGLAPIVTFSIESFISRKLPGRYAVVALVLALTAFFLLLFA